MQNPSLYGRWLIAPTLLLAFCSQGPSPSPTSPSNASAAAAAGKDGLVGALAAGDVKVGSGAIEIVRLRMDRQTPSGTSIVRQYANPGQTYAMRVGETIELWAEWDSTAVPGNPRFKVEWGDGSEADITGCGSCLLKHPYRTAGIYTVKASLDDRVSTTTTRTFFLDSREAAPTPTPTPTPAQTGFRTVNVRQVGPTLAQYTRCGSVTNNGFTCNDPIVQYGTVDFGVPNQHGNNDFPLWCQQLGFNGWSGQVTYGARSTTAPYGQLFWCSGYDEIAPKWCDWQDGYWFNQQLDYHFATVTAITSITCN